MGPGRELFGPADAWVVPRLVAFVGDEVEHLLDWSMDDELTLYLCHGECTSLAVMVGGVVVGQQGWKSHR